MSRFLKLKSFPVQLDCYPCFLRQTSIALKMAEADEDISHEVMAGVLNDIKTAGGKRTPSHAATPVHKRIQKLLGRDPFTHARHRYNTLAMKLYPNLKAQVAESDNPLEMAAKLAIAGNVIDFGVYSNFNIEDTIKRALEEPLAANEFEDFNRDVVEAGDILYLLDNTGEIVFDRILIEELQRIGKKVVAVTRGAPVLNDCTMKDAKEVGLTEVCRVIDNESANIGTALETSSRGFRERFAREGTLVISKGQANFETLVSERRLIYFLFQAKCEAIARLLEIENGSMLLVKGGG